MGRLATYLQQFTRQLLRPRTYIVLAALLLYIVGIKFVLVPLLVIVMSIYLPFPKILASRLARLLTSLFILFGCVQVAALVQFFVRPSSGFGFIAGLLTLQVLLLLAWLSARGDTSTGGVPLLTKTDKAALLGMLCVVASFGVLAGFGNLQKITNFGSTQSVDGTHHYLMTAEMHRNQHFTYASGSDTYPKGFHIAVAFAQHSLHINVSNISWSSNARLFMLQYLVFGSLLVYFACYLARQLLDWLGSVAQASKPSVYTLGLILGSSLGLFYVLPFLHHGFLNYYYIATALIIGLLFLNDYGQMLSTKTADKRVTTPQQWCLLAYCYLLLGISTSWPLLIPPLLLTPFVYMLRPKMKVRDYFGLVIKRQHWLLVMGLLVQLIPLYIQFYYGRGNFSSEGLNAYGAIRVFHYGVMIVGVLGLLYVYMSQEINEKIKTFCSAIFLPLLMLLTGLMAMQYFGLGELRYYSIKSAYLVEMLLIVLLVSLLIERVYRSLDTSRLVLFFGLPLIVGSLLLMLIGFNDNPLKDVRNTYRQYSKVGYPAYFQEDVRGIVQLGQENKIKSYNAIVLHYDAQSDKLSGNMQIPYWSSTLVVDTKDKETRFCNSRLYSIATYGEADPLQQRKLIDIIRDCAALARNRQRSYYIVTDPASRERLQQLFGDLATII